MMKAGKTLWRMRTLIVCGILVLGVAGTASAGGKRCRHDADCDGLSNQDERTTRTNPWRPDSDGDGLTDAFEANRLGTSPLVADTDGDGAGDGDEVCDGTDPNVDEGDGDNNDNDDGDMGEHQPRIAAPVDAVDPVGMTLTIFGCLVVDVSMAELEHGLVLADLAPGTFVKVKLDGTKLPMLVATEVEAEDGMSHGGPGDGEGDGEDCPDDGTPDGGEGDETPEGE